MMKEKRQIITRGAVLNVLVEGHPKNPALLFLHGFPDHHAVWAPVIDQLKDRYYCITYDMRGVAGSRLLNNRLAYRMDKMLGDISAVITQIMGPSGKVHLIGHDLGSVQGWSFVADTTLRQQVLSWTSISGPHIRLMLDWVLGNLRSPDAQKREQARDQFMHSWYVFAFHIPGLLSVPMNIAPRKYLTSLAPELKDCSLMQLSDADLKRSVLNYVNFYRHNVFLPPPMPARGSITTPSQLIIPVQDNYVRHFLFDTLDDYVTDLTRHEVDATHWLQHTHAQLLARLIDDFARQHDNTGEEHAA